MIPVATVAPIPILSQPSAVPGEGQWENKPIRKYKKLELEF